MSIKTETKVGVFILASIALFAYSAMHLGFFRFAARNYTTYYMLFEDLGGLVKKADVKIAGVKVGWVDNIQLVDSKAKVRLAVQKDYGLRTDAVGEIRQEGLVGAKYMELLPGTNLYPQAEPNLTFIREGRPAVSLEVVLNRFETISQNIEDVSIALKESIGNSEQKEQIRSIISNIDTASTKIAHFTDVLVRDESEIANLGRDIGNASRKFSSAMDQFNSIMGKVDKGEGLVGKLVNEPDIYDDLKVVSCGFKKAANIVDNVEIFFDNHFESMFKPAENYELEDAKGYFDMRFRSKEDTFYQFQVVGTQRGALERDVKIIDRVYINPSTGKPYTEKELNALPGSFYITPSERVKSTEIKRNQTKFGIQIGKTYSNLATRFGIFENSVGVGLDYQIPFDNSRFRWVTSFEAFDLRGQSRIDDNRPHLKWINKLHFLDNIYLAFGADDFVSRKNANAFIGGGVRFTDDDLKYLIAKLGVFNSIPLGNK